MTVDQAVAELRELGFADAALTGEKTPLANGETRLEYSSTYVFDQPVLVQDAAGDVRLEPWSWPMDKD